ncbi:MAG: hypothetical protein ABFD52_04880 [Acidobacteriota bacterium]
MKINLDRPRDLRITPYALKRLQSVYGGRALPSAIGAIKEEKGLRLIARYLWLFAVDEDPGLTPEKMEGIVAGWIGGGWMPGRLRKLKKLGDTINELIREFTEKEKGNGERL